MANDSSNFLPLLSMALAVIGLLLLVLGSKENTRARALSTAYFVAGVTGLTISFLYKNPDILESAQEYVAITLVGLVIATVSVIRLLMRK